MRRASCTVAGGVTTLLALGIGLLVALFHYLAGPVPSLSAPTVGVPEGTEAPQALTVFFTRPDEGNSRTLRGGLDALLAAAIDEAQFQVDVAAYDLDLWSIRDALLRAHRRGVKVRVVAETSHLNRPEFQALLQAGIPIVDDQSEGLMHNKFVIIDGWEVWTGSMNFTLNGVYRNDNNLVRIRSTRVAQDYTAEFEEMFVERHFGPDTVLNTLYPQVRVDGTPIEVFFAPDDVPRVRLLALVRQAQHEVLFLAFNWTDDGLTEALLDRATAGVTVRGVLDATQAARSQGNDYARLRAAGIAVRLDGNPYAMHHKVLVVDGRWVVTGSYNFTRSAAERNDENVVVIDSPALAEAFRAEFERVWGLAQP